MPSLMLLHTFSDHFACRMDAVGFQTAYGCALPRLGRSYLEADSVSAVPTWTVSQKRYDASFFLLTRLCRKYFVTMGLRSMKWDEWIGTDIHDSSLMAVVMYSWY